jgi:hypothetical protein
MLSVKLIISKKIHTLSENRLAWRFLFTGGFFFLAAVQGFGQDNSPYSRYGLGDIVPSTNVINRGMGGISAAYSDPLSINFNNPASYASFQAFLEEKSKKVKAGRVLLDVGMNFENRTLRTANPPQKFAASNALFSYVQVGIPIKHNWGVSFGLKPLSRISYKIVRDELLFDPNSGQPIDSALTEFSGNGGTYLASFGTGVAIKNFSIGGTFGYLFGNKEYATKRALRNDSVTYNNANHTTKTSFGNIYFNGGAQYKIALNKTTALKLGVFGSLKNTMNASQDIINETFIRNADNGDLRIDSVYDQKNIKGEVVYPSSYGAGFVIEKAQSLKEGGWLLGVDYVQNKWSEYRFFGAKDAVQDNWEVRIGGQLRPKPTKNYWSNVAYRAGFSFGPDYVNVQEELPRLGVSVGLGLPMANYNRLSPDQFSIINVALEYNKRGNNDNLLKENLFRVSIGLSFSDLWFRKRKYE